MAMTSNLPMAGIIKAAWMEQAICSQVDPEIFFPVHGESAQAAQRICETCPVQQTCLQWALDHNENFGVWGGLTAEQREKLGYRSKTIDREESLKGWGSALYGHGTAAGAKRHWREGTPMCRSCRNAELVYKRELRDRRNRTLREGA